MNRLLLFAVFVILSGTAVADSFRCGRAIVKVGDSSNTLLRKCGEPARKYSSKETVSDRGRQIRAGVSNWVYARKAGKDMIAVVYSGAVIKLHID